VILLFFPYKNFFFNPPKERKERKRKDEGRSGEMEKWYKECGGSGRRREKREVKWWRSSGVIEEDDWKEWMER
jgi:hypothetical protein